MLTDNDIYFFWNKYPERQQMAIAFGLEGKVIVDFATYVDFYDNVLSVADEVVPNNEDHSNVSFKKNGEVIETLQTSPFFGSLLCSSPDIFELYRHPNPEQLAKNGKVAPGWVYDSEGNFSEPYEGWGDEIVDGMYNIDKEYNLLEFYTGE